MSIETEAAGSRASTDRVEKVMELRAPRSRVWRAITTAEEFAQWFRVKLDGQFAEGATVTGDVSHADGRHACAIEMQIERMEPEGYFSYRWHPYPMDPTVDYSSEPTTLVEFTLRETESGTTVTIVESGFDQIPIARRAEALLMNTGGWAGQMKNLARYVE